MLEDNQQKQDKPKRNYSIVRKPRDQRSSRIALKAKSCIKLETSNVNDLRFTQYLSNRYSISSLKDAFYKIKTSLFGAQMRMFWKFICFKKGLHEFNFYFYIKNGRRQRMENSLFLKHVLYDLISSVNSIQRQYTRFQKTGQDNQRYVQQEGNNISQRKYYYKKQKQTKKRQRRREQKITLQDQRFMKQDMNNFRKIQHYLVDYHKFNQYLQNLQSQNGWTILNFCDADNKLHENNKVRVIYQDDKYYQVSCLFQLNYFWDFFGENCCSFIQHLGQWLKDVLKASLGQKYVGDKPKAIVNSINWERKNLKMSHPNQQQIKKQNPIVVVIFVYTEVKKRVFEHILKPYKRLAKKWAETLGVIPHIKNIVND